MGFVHGFLNPLAWLGISCLSQLWNETVWLKGDADLGIESDFEQTVHFLTVVAGNYSGTTSFC